MGVFEQYRTLAPWRLAIYVVCTAAVFALVIWDIVDESARYTSVIVIALIIVSILVRPGGIRGPRRSR